MIRLPLDQHNGRGPNLEVIVELADEGYAVQLTVELEAGETGPHLPGVLNEAAELGSVYAATMTDADWARARLLELTDQLDAARAEAADLRQRIIDARNRSDISRQLLPDEARALAAVLVHFAGEAERR